MLSEVSKVLASAWSDRRALDDDQHIWRPSRNHLVDGMFVIGKKKLLILGKKEKDTYRMGIKNPKDSNLWF